MYRDTIFKASDKEIIIMDGKDYRNYHGPHARYSYPSPEAGRPRINCYDYDELKVENMKEEYLHMPTAHSCVDIAKAEQRERDQRKDIAMGKGAPSSGSGKTGKASMAPPPRVESIKVEKHRDE